MRIDAMALEQARNIDVVAFLEKRCGYAFAMRCGDYRCVQHPSLAIKGDRRTFYWHSKGAGGFGAIDYLMKIERMLFRDAMEAIMPSNELPLPPLKQTSATPEQPKSLILPEKANSNSRLYDYLCRRRGIDGVIVSALIQEGRLYEDKRGNVIFLGFDEAGKTRFASLRGTYGNRVFRMDCAGSSKRYAFHMTHSQSDQLNVYESPISAMSHGSLENALHGDKNAWKRTNRLSLAGTSGIAIPKYLEAHPCVKKLVFCLDNDESGRNASELLSKQYADKGFRISLEFPKEKDFNDDLTSMLKTRLFEKTQKPPSCFLGAASYRSMMF